MVSTETLQVVIQARDMLSDKIKGVNNALKQTGTTANTAGTTATSATNRIGQAYTQLQSKVTSVFNNIRNIIRNSTVGKAINESSLAQPFLNAAEKIKQKWTSMTETIKSKLKGITSSSNNTGGFNISAAGLATLNGQVTTTTGKVTLLGNTMNRIAGIASKLGINFGTAFTTASAKIEGFRNKLSTIGSKVSSVVSGLSGVQSAIMSAFGLVGVTSLKSFTIEAAIAREKVNAITKSVTGSSEAFTKTQQSIKTAIAGTTLGYNNMATAVNNVALRFHVTGDAVSNLAGPMSKVGILAQAMGKSSSEAASIMEHAFDGLQGKWRQLKTLGITEDDLKAAGWSGAADDVNGYAAALDKVLEKNPKFKEFTNTFEYQWESLKMSIKGVGTEIGMILLPILKQLLSWFTTLNKECPWLTKILVILAVAFLGIISVLSALAPIILMVAELWTEEAAAQMLALAPYILIAAAIIAVIAILWHLYNTNESVRNTMNRIGETIKKTVLTAWENLQKIIQPLIPTFQHLMDVIGRAINDFLRMMGITSETGENFDTLSAIVQVLGILLHGFVSYVTGVVQVLAAVLVPVINLVINVFANLISFITTVAEAFSLLMSGDVVGFFTTLGEALSTFLLDNVTVLGQFFIELLNNLGTVLMGAGSLVGSWIINFITQGVLGAYTFVMGFIGQIMALPGQLWLWLNDAYLRFLAWKTYLIESFKLAASNAVNGFISYIMGLPGKVWTWLLNTITKIKNFASQAKQKMFDAAKSIVDGFKSKITSLPSVMWTELMNIKTKIQNAVGSLVGAIKQLGWNLLTNFKSALGIASPGHMSHAIEDEMNYISGHITGAYNTLSREAEGLGNNIMEGFNRSGASNIATTISGDGSVGYAVAHSISDNTGNAQNKLMEQLIRLLKELVSIKQEENIDTITVNNDGTVTVKHDLNITGLPETIDEETVIEILRQEITSKDVIKQLTSNREFQSMDQRFKDRIVREYARHI